jgi:hypothetical protein
VAECMAVHVLRKWSTIKSKHITPLPIHRSIGCDTCVSFLEALRFKPCREPADDTS